MRILLAIVAIALLSQSCFAANKYYVTNNGGTGTGLDSTTNAWSFAKLNATSSITGDDSVLFHAGETFYGVLTTRAGTAGHPVKYGRYGAGANPVISGLTTLTTWTLYSGNIYYTTVSDTLLNVVMYDGAIRGRGRYPKTGYLTFTSHTVGATASTTASITGTAVGAIPFNPAGAEIVIRKIRQVTDRHLVTSRVGNTLNLGGAYYGNNAAYIVGDGNGWFIQNHISCLTADGDWYFDRSTNRLYMYNPVGHTVKASTIDRLSAFSFGKNYINVSNIDFEGADNECTYMSGSAHDINFYNCNWRNAMVAVLTTDLNNVMTDGKTNVLWYGGSISNMLDNAIKGNLSDYMTIDGMTITNIFQIAGAGSSGDGRGDAIGILGKKNTVRKSILKNLGFHGIRLFGDSTLVEYNFLDSFCNVKDDAAGIYDYDPFNAFTSGKIIRYNTVLHAIGAIAGAPPYEQTSKAAAVYFDDVNGIEMYGNVLAHGTWTGLHWLGDGANYVHDNLFYDFDEHQVMIKNFTNTLIRGLNFINNTLIATKPTSYTLHVKLQQPNDNPGLFGTMNNNIYARPVDDNATILFQRQYDSSGTWVNTSNTYTLSQWKSYFNQDAASTKSQVTITDTSLFRFNYNYSATPVTVPFSGIYKDINNTDYSASITLPAYSAAVSIYNPATPVLPTGTQILITPAGVILKYNGKILTVSH